MGWVASNKQKGIGMRKLVIVINGRGGVGKDTLCDIVASRYPTENISAITPIKEIAALGGWDGRKDEKSRKLLADLKQLFVEYNDFCNEYLLAEHKRFLASEKEVLFVHIREPEEIAKFVASLKGACATLLIRSGTVHSPLGNNADDKVEEYAYDYYYVNEKPLEQATEDFLAFFEDLQENETKKKT